MMYLLITLHKDITGVHHTYFGPFKSKRRAREYAKAAKNEDPTLSDFIIKPITIPLRG